jgi:predicted negative regulator of RcsB-dependent stress response
MSNETLKTNYTNKIINLIKNNLKIFVICSFIMLFLLIGFLFYKTIQEKDNVEISENYTEASILIEKKRNEESKLLLENIINKNHQFYSPMALYLLIDNEIEKNPLRVIMFFDKILKNNSVNKEDLNLIKIKKAIYLINLDNEELIIKTLNPVIKSNSVWKKVAINLISQYFISKNQNVKAEEYIQLLNNEKIK